ncbi:SDR family NAD(P)-dependent oxidoreductase [Parvularcula dongshanensis]|uniref:NAD(P)-dependent dehydrogenase (Short-subunit alcohol dehydrogenase family) n=1 Tax=Parvularcula dongshanensis TaxID=1173995 RepID=A0A840I2B2_9PROT|nr:SDR family oxidoreductase [Parvularcula dongshanensis]MBB4658959.1 NAD(P)-dependent dehydrogenase (short-subunit alcohol dehydrogenase family) [Parvularcula dongshanensis]
MTKSLTAHYPSLAAKRVFVTGGATGVGGSAVEAFASQGALVGFVDKNVRAGEALCGRVQAATGNEPWFAPVDVTVEGALAEAIRTFAEDRNGLDVLVNNVANDARHDPMDVTLERWRENFSVNVDAAFFGAQAALKLMIPAGGGAIINISSINALLGFPNMPGYITAKSALLGMTKALANEYGPAGIRVNAVLPGWVATERQLETWLTPEAEAEWSTRVALKGRIEPSDVANLILFLSSNDSRMITSQFFIIDAGRT